MLDDDTERIEVTLFDETFAQFKHLIAKHAVLIVEGQLRYDDFLNGWRVTAKRVRSADEVIEEQARRLTIPWHGDLGSFDHAVSSARATIRSPGESRAVMVITSLGGAS